MATSFIRPLHGRYVSTAQLTVPNVTEPYLDRGEVIRVILDGVGTDEIAIDVELYFIESYFVDDEEIQVWKSDVCSHEFWTRVQKCVQTRTALCWRNSLFKKRSIIGLICSLDKLKVEDAIYFKRAAKKLRDAVENYKYPITIANAQALLNDLSIPITREALSLLSRSIRVDKKEKFYKSFFILCYHVAFFVINYYLAFYLSVIQLFCVYTFLKYKKVNKLQNIAQQASLNVKDIDCSFTSSTDSESIQAITDKMLSKDNLFSSANEKVANKVIATPFQCSLEEDDEDDFLAKKNLDLIDVDEQSVIITPISRAKSRNRRLQKQLNDCLREPKDSLYSPILPPLNSIKSKEEPDEEGIKSVQLPSDRAVNTKREQNCIKKQERASGPAKRTTGTANYFAESKMKLNRQEYSPWQMAAQQAAANDALIAAMHWPATPIVDTELRLKCAQKKQEYEALQFELKELAAREQELIRHMESLSMRQKMFTEQKRCREIAPSICQSVPKQAYRLPATAYLQKSDVPEIKESKKKTGSSMKQKKEVKYAPNRAYFLRFEKNRRISEKAQSNGSLPQ